MINLIVAVDSKWGIGNQGKLLASVPADMRFFKETTTGNVVIMGRKTLESFPGGRPLANRDNIVITSDPNFEREGVIVTHSPKEALEAAKRFKKEIYVIGGGQIYEEMLDLCDRAYVTYICRSYEADTYFPNLDKKANWVLVSESEEQTYFETTYYFRMYQRRVDFQA